MVSLVNSICHTTEKAFAQEFCKLVAHALHSVIDMTTNQQFLYACLDIFNNRFNCSMNPPIKKTAPKFLLKLMFQHKIMEDLRIEQFVKSPTFKNLFPGSELPTVVYTYAPALRSSIFNYYDTFQNTDMKSFVKNFIVDSTPTCNCASSPFKDSHHNHVITGDLSIIPHLGLRSLFALGPSYIPVPKLNIKKIHSNLVTNFRSCIKKWSSKLHVSRLIFEPLLNEFSKHCQDRLMFFQNNYQHNRQISLDDPDIEMALNNLQDTFIITPIDKAPNNIGLTCKWYGIYITLKELGILPHTINTTYEHSVLTESEVIDYIRDNFPFNNLNLLDEDNQNLPYIYPIPKLHKQPLKFRFIISGVNTFLKPALKACTNVLRAIKNQQLWYCNYLYSVTGYNRMWICNKSQDIIKSINTINDKNSACDTESYDFSTLYTNFEHEDLIANINWCINKTFNSHNRRFVTFNSLESKSSNFSAHLRYKFNFNRDDCKLLHTWIVHNLYFKCSNLIFIQRIGIPIGADPAPFQADLALHKDEYVFMEGLCREKKFAEAKSFNHTHRYLDDINPKNNHGNFAKYKDTIYAPGLTINKENNGTLTTSMLDIDMTIDPVTKQFSTKLYDKRNDFGFPIVKFPNVTSNIHSRTCYNVFVTQVIRISRVCNRLHLFLHALKNLFNTMIAKGCKKHILLKKLYVCFVKKDLYSKYKIDKDTQLLVTVLAPYLRS